MAKFQLNVLFEDNHLICVNKPAGMLVQGDSTGDKPLAEHVKDYIKEKYNKPGAVFLRVIHRIDRPVSGVVMFARTSKALERMNKMLREKQVYKTYWAVVKRKPQSTSGKLNDYLLKNPDKNVTKVVDKTKKGGLRSELTYSTLGRLNDHFLLEINPITGRPHQIRVQLSNMGCPIRGDLKYGFAKPNPDKSINLHARKLRFEHPVKKEPVLITAPLPTDPFWEQYLSLEEVKEKELNLLLKNK